MFRSESVENYRLYLAERITEERKVIEALKKQIEKLETDLQLDETLLATVCYVEAKKEKELTA